MQRKVSSVIIDYDSIEWPLYFLLLQTAERSGSEDANLSAAVSGAMIGTILGQVNARHDG